MRPVTAGGEALVTAGAVASGAPPPVVVAADLLCLGLCGVFGASRRDPGFLGWPTRGKKRAVRGRVRGGEAVVTPGPGAGFARPCECLSVQLWVYLAPGGQAKPSCLPPESNVIGHACRVIVLCMACGDDVEIGHKISGPLWLVGGQVVGVYSKAPRPLYKGGDLSLLGFPREGKSIVLP